MLGECSRVLWTCNLPRCNMPLNKIKTILHWNHIPYFSHDGSWHFFTGWTPRWINITFILLIYEQISMDYEKKWNSYFLHFMKSTFYEIGKAYFYARRLWQYLICTSRRFQKPSGDESQYFYHHMIPQSNVHVYLINFKNETCLF